MVKTKLALIGLGYWGPNYARIISESDNIELSYCCDISRSSLEKIHKRYPYIKTSSNYKDILKDSELKGIIVVTPPATHYQIVKDCLSAGKDVLVEKPITLNSKDADKLVDLAKNKKRILMVDHIFQFNPAVRKLKEIVSKKKLGKIFYITGSYTALGPVRTDVNSLWDLAPHYFYILEYLIGKYPSWVSVFGESYLAKGREDIIFINLQFPVKISVNIQVSWLYPYKVRNLVLVGSKRMAVFDDIHSDEKIRIYNKGASYDKNDPDYPNILRVTYREGDLIIPRITPSEPLVEVLHTFVDSIYSRILKESDGMSGRNTIKILEAAQKSLEQGGKVVNISYES